MTAVRRGSHLHRLLTMRDSFGPLDFTFKIKPMPYKVPQTNTNHGRPYVPREYREYKDLIRKSVQQQYDGPCLESNVRLYCRFYFVGGLHGDEDNLRKALKDALQACRTNEENKIKWRGIFKDDRQVLGGGQEIYYQSEMGDDWPGFEGSRVIIVPRYGYDAVAGPPEVYDFESGEEYTGWAF